MTTLHGPDLTQLASSDPRVARELAAAERERLAAAQRIAGEDAAVERRLRMQEGELRLAGQRDQVKAARAERRRQEWEARRQAKRKRKQARRQELAAWAERRVAYVRANAAAVYSGLIYGLAVSGAVYGQVDAARANGLPTPVGVIAAIAIEGTGLAMALTAQHQRLQGERALAARALIWVCTAAAVAINAIGHHHDPVKAIGLSFLSALGIIVYEVRSGAKHRPVLRKKGVLPEPPERFGWRRWLVAPRPTFAAWKQDVRDRLSPGAAALIARAESARAERRRLAAAAQERQRQLAVVAEVTQRARAAARKAARKGEAGPALAALMHLAHTGSPAPTLVLPSRAHLEAEAAREEARTVRAALAEAEARMEAEATRRTEAEAEARAARAIAEAEATRRAEAEAATRAAHAVAEAEATRRAKAEAEALRAARAQGVAEAEAGQWQHRVGVAETAVAEAHQELRAERQRRQATEVRAATAEGALAGERQRREQAEEQLRQLAEQAAEPPRRSRRTPAPAEPVLFNGVAVPEVPGVGAATVLAVLQARRDNPDATQKQLAKTVQVTDRTVRSVLSALPDDQALVSTAAGGES